MYFQELINTIGPLELPSNEVNYLINTTKFKSELLIILKHFNYDLGIFTYATIESNLIRVSIKDLLNKLCTYYGIRNDRDMFTTLSVYILNTKSGYEQISQNIFKVQDLVVDLSNTNDKIKRVFQNKLLADLQLFKTIIINRRKFSKIYYSDLDMRKLDLYVAYLIREYMSEISDEYIYDECLKALYNYLKDNSELVDTDYKFVMFEEGKIDKTFSIRNIENFVNSIQSKRI